MKTLIILAVLLSVVLFCDSAFGDDKKRAAWAAEFARLDHIYARKPRRLERPLRAENVSDDEVREIQAATNKVYPGAIANISGVTDGCPCEEGSKCTSQVWVVAYRNGRYDGLMLSRVDGMWTVGQIQSWWIRYEGLRNRFRETLSDNVAERREQYRKLRDKQRQLMEEFPVCSLQD